MTSVKTKNIVFDDRDTDRFRYAGGWFLQGSYNASRTGETGTLSSTKDTTANVTFTFPTPALSFSYYGIPRCCGGMYAICVDCDPNKPNFIPIDAVVPTDDGQNPPVVLYTQRFDKPGIHEVILTNQADPRFGGNSQITLDRFELEVPDLSVPAPTVIATTVSSPVPTRSTPVGATSSSTSSNIAMITGIIGGVVVLLLALFAFYMYRRRRRRRLTAELMETPPMEYTYAPRIAPSPGPGFLSSAPSMRSTSLGHAQGWHATNPSVSASSTTHLFPSSASSATGSRAPRREQDAGRLEDEEDEPTLPPEYGQVFGRSRRTRGASIAASQTTGAMGDLESNAGGSSQSSGPYRPDVKDRSGRF